MSSAGLLLTIISLAQVLYCNPFSWAYWIIVEIVFVSGWMIVNSCRLEQLCISLQSTKFVVWAEILMLQTHQNVSSSRFRIAGMTVWTAEAYCCKSCASLPWCTLVASHKHLWVQLREIGNGSGMLARRNSHLAVHSWLLFVLRTLLLCPHQEWRPDRHRSPFTPQLCYLRRLHWGAEGT